MNLNYNDLCTVFIVTYYSHNKIKSCLDSIPSKYNVIIFDNSGQLEYKKEIENAYPNTRYIVSKINLGIPKRVLKNLKNLNLLIGF